MPRLIGQEECGEVSVKSSQCQVEGEGLNESERPSKGIREGRLGAEKANL